MLEQVGPEIAFFLSNKLQEPRGEENEQWRVQWAEWRWRKNKLKS
jgi:hypothetical protein